MEMVLIFTLSTWNKLTVNKPPAQTSCSVQLTSQNAFNFDQPRCFYKPGTDFGNAYYHSVVPIDDNKQVIFTFNHGDTHSVY